MDYVVVLAARNEQHLAELELRLREANVSHAAFREPDLGHALTAIGLTPIEDRRTVRRLLASYSLLGEEP